MPHDPRPALLRAALDAAERGWPVFPLWPGSKRPVLHAEHACPGTGECAHGHAKWEQRASTDPHRIHTAWTLRPFNIGLATGPARLVVIDLDKPKPTDSTDTPCGVTAFTALCERAGQPTPQTRRIRTASGGTHLYFTAPAGVRLGNTAGKLAPLIDTRAWGGYVVAPGSTTPHGTYEVTDHAPPAPLPRWLLDALTPPPPPRTVVGTPAVRDNMPAYAAAALRNETHNVATAPEGTRNARLLRAARALGRLVASGDLTRTEVENALSGAAVAVGEESPRYYADVITRALNWSITHNPHGRAA
ncbi:bifunctional DNA primase/polymerase [Streptomyces sp. JJ66]|uniref:bifunctional DNA primase/polymerase n=1 Tax=Streptomyces sp. JJ66 TaxID=2803843 RepID=UPI001C5691E7|nr:bifunctional DNA primase/polymerase [Streptomyces sp. JJ66]MBW1601781.1 bifunctional DNA primase/polymerase [Streptomyces sp. JJ66]